MIPGWRRSELISLAFHREVAKRLRADPDGVLKKARGNLAKMRSVHGRSSEPYFSVWEKLLDGPMDELMHVLLTDDQESFDLRQCTPFAGIVPEKRRQDILKRLFDEIRQDRVGDEAPRA